MPKNKGKKQKKDMNDAADLKVPSPPHSSGTRQQRLQKRQLQESY